MCLTVILLYQRGRASLYLPQQGPIIWQCVPYGLKFPELWEGKQKKKVVFVFVSEFKHYGPATVLITLTSEKVK